MELRLRLPILGALLLCVSAPGWALADMPAVLNKVRAQSCGARQPLRSSARLDRVARLLSQGTQLQQAEQSAGYHAARSVSLSLSGVGDERSLELLLRRQLCSQLGSIQYRELGVHRRGSELWIILAQPIVVPDPREQAAIAQRVLLLTNQARAHARSCGGQWLPAAPPVRLNALLERAARAHSRDMAAHGYMDHTALDGSSPADRVTRVGYVWRAVGENLASGMGTADEVVAGWLHSPHHCENIMGREYRQMGIAFGVNLNTKGGVYWTQLFGLPRS